MSELLLELGTEELPASAVRRAYGELAAKVTSLLTSHGVLEPANEPVTFGTPRRLIVSLSGVTPVQADSMKDQRGPGIKAAYDAEGKPTQALLGFCRSQGVEVEDLRSDGQYVWVTKTVSGKFTSAILSEGLPNIVRSLTFDKTMRWGSSKMRFARPIRWMLATLDSQVIDFDLEGVQSSNESRGHRFYAPESFTAPTVKELLEELRSKKVEPDPQVRREMILRNLPVGPEDHPDLPEALIDENVFLTEWPTPILGRFEEEFLELPAPVLSTVMAKHEKMFPVRDGEGNITNRFIFVRNSGQDDSVRAGCEWVLNARMNDAKFFYDEDKRLTLEDFLAKTKGIVFQEKLGVVYSRSERLTQLARMVCPHPIQSEKELDFASEAGRLAKADLSTGLVGELASLQGIVGGDYARREGLPEEVCWAISTQYDPAKNPEPETASERTAVRLVVADQLDKLAGYLGIGLEPSGSSDPYALRRAVSILIETAWSWPSSLPSFVELFTFASQLYIDQGVNLDVKSSEQALGRLFVARYPAQMPGVRHDILEGALLSENLEALTSPQAVKFRVELLSALAEDAAFVQTATRPINIVSAARKKGIEIGETLDLGELESESGERLFLKSKDIQAELGEAVKGFDVSKSLSLLRQLQEPINAFFEGTMVMVEDLKVRDARLALLAKVGALLSMAGDFTKIVFEGNR